MLKKIENRWLRVEYYSSGTQELTLSVNGKLYKWYNVGSQEIEELTEQLEKGYNQGRLLQGIKIRYGEGERMSQTKEVVKESKTVLGQEPEEEKYYHDTKSYKGFRVGDIVKVKPSSGLYFSETQHCSIVELGTKYAHVAIYGTNKGVYNIKYEDLVLLKHGEGLFRGKWIKESKTVLAQELVPVCSKCGKPAPDWDDSPPVYCDECLPSHSELPPDPDEPERQEEKMKDIKESKTVLAQESKKASVITVTVTVDAYETDRIKKAYDTDKTPEEVAKIAIDNLIFRFYSLEYINPDSEEFLFTE